MGELLFVFVAVFVIAVIVMIVAIKKNLAEANHERIVNSAKVARKQDEEATNAALNMIDESEEDEDDY